MSAVAVLARAHRTLACVVGEGIGVPIPGMAVLRLLACRESATIGEIAEVGRVDVSVVSRQVSSLVDLGLVEREIAETDRRVRTLRLTDAGHEMYRRMTTELQARADVGFDGWSSEELVRAAAALRRVGEAIERSSTADLPATTGPPPRAPAG
ncbi:MAG: MarR family winged helix-turn-helix transcriptional regulator [Micrococcales bacterium]|nr:MarR family winged helix-turn-helix transcriptional regulator [Micrococcales bacterium]